MTRIKLLLAIGLVVAAAGLRLLPHGDNFAPVAAVALFGGAVLPRRLGVFVPLVAMIASDIIIGFHPLIPVTWGCYLLIALASNRYWQRGGWMRKISLVAGSSLFFFVATNFAVWLQGDLYPYTLAGLGQCFAMALPFFRNTLLSDVFYSGALFGLYALAIQMGGRLVHSFSGAAKTA